jgi:hypothetical protein
MATLHILNWKNVLAVKAIGGIGLIVKVLTLGPMETNTWVSTKIIRYMVKALSLGLVEPNTWVSTKIVRDMVKALKLGLMEQHRQVFGKMMNI